jgi:hypothetical protein
MPSKKIANPTTRFVDVTPAMAEAFLEKQATQRTMRSGRPEKHAREMLAGTWANNGQGILFDWDGLMMNGQHRMWGLVLAGAENPKVTARMLFVEGLDPAVMPTIDTGASRGFRDVLQLGGLSNTSLLAAMTKWLYWYEHARPEHVHVSTCSPTHTELAEYLGHHTDITVRAGEVAGTKRARRRVTPSVLGMVYTLAFRKHPEKAPGWLALIDSGATGDDPKHPVLQLINRLEDNRNASAKLPQEDVAALTIKSWNLYLAGRRVELLRWASKQEAFPEVK